MTGTGLLVGSAVALAVTRLLATFLYGVKANDVVTFAGVIAIFTLVSLTASTIPALRATRVDRVTRKVNLADRSAGYQCHSVFTQAAENYFTNLRTYFVGLTTVTSPPKLRSLLWNAA